MRTLISLAESFQNNNKGEDSIKSFCKNTLENMLFTSSSIESDMRALLRKSALIRKRIAEHKSLVKDKNILEKEKTLLIDELKLLNSFMQYVKEEMPIEALALEDCIKRNERYIKLNVK